MWITAWPDLYCTPLRRGFIFEEAKAPFASAPPRPMVRLDSFTTARRTAGTRCSDLCYFAAPLRAHRGVAAKKPLRAKLAIAFSRFGEQSDRRASHGSE